MRKYFTLLLMVLTAAESMAAAVMTPSEALERAQKAAPKTVKTRMPALRTDNAVTLVYTLADSLTSEPSLYAFNQGGEADGWMIVSADDVAVPLLGYCDHGSIDPGNMPPALKYWLGCYQDEIKAARKRRARVGDDLPGEGRPYRAPIDPLCATRWNQDAPYNNLCPTKSGTRTATGCVATAMAQVMKYHNHPTKGTGTKSYKWNYKNMSVDFSQTTFDWANMLDIYTSGSYSTAEGNAVATLMKACGYSVEMDYDIASNGGSGAMTEDVAQSLVDYFDYDAGCIFTERQLYTTRQWEDLIYNNLRDYGPVELQGRCPDGGHAFVCDGLYASAYFHINWGWGGLSDGYFLMSALDPDAQGIGGSTAGFNTDQGAIINIKPNAGGSPINGIKCPYMASVSDIDAAAGTFKLNGWFTPISPAGFTGYLVFKAEAEDGSVTPLGLGQIDGLEYGSAYPAFTIQNLNTLPDGTYKLYVYYTDQQSYEGGTPIPFPANQSQYVTFTKGNGTLTAVMPLADNTRVTGIDLKTPIYVGRPFQMDIFLTSQTPSVENIQFCPYFFDTNQNPKYYTDDLIGDVFNGDNVFDYHAKAPAASKLPAGNYLLGFVQSVMPKIVKNSSGSYSQSEQLQVICDNLWPVTVLADPGAADLCCVADNDADQNSFVIANDQAVDKWGIELTYSVKNKSGYFADNIRMQVYDAWGNYITSFFTPFTPIAGGERYTGTTTIQWPEAAFNTTYRASFYAANSNNGYDKLNDSLISFRTASTTAVSDIDVDTAPSATHYYDLQGRAVASPSLPGLYIRRDTYPDGTTVTSRQLRR